MYLFQGEWKPKQIDNPNYKGSWVHPETDNPDYTPDSTIYKFDNIGVIGLDLWQVCYTCVVLWLNHSQGDIHHDQQYSQLFLKNTFYNVTVDKIDVTSLNEA